MANPSSPLTLETQAQQALVIGTQSPFVQKLEKALHDQGVEVYYTPLIAEKDGSAWRTRISPGSLLHKIQSLSPDYYIVVNDHELDNFLATKENRELLERAEEKLAYAKKCYLTTTGESKTGEHARQIVFDEIFGGGEQDNTIVYLTEEALREKKMTIPGDGLETIHPTYITDAVQGTLEVLFDPYVQERSILFTSPSEISYLNLAYKIRALLPQKSDLVFGKEGKKRQKQGKQITEVTNWRPRADFDAALQETVEALMKHVSPREKSDEQESAREEEDRLPPAAHEKPKHLSPLKKLRREPKEQRVEFVRAQTRESLAARLRAALKTRKQKPPTPTTTRRTVVIILILVAALYVASMVTAAAGATQGIRSVARDVKAGRGINRTKLIVTEVATTYLHANTTLATTMPLIGRATKLQELDGLLQTMITTLEVAQDSRELLATAGEITRHILAKESTDITSAISRARLQTEELYKTLSLIEGELPESAPSVIPTSLQDDYQSLRQELKKVRQAMLAAKGILTVMPEAIGVQGSRKYAILLQNNTELRPTGGFIGSFAIADFESGELFNLQVLDVYQADGQLKGRVEPPKEIKDYLGETNWYLRDSNWDPDFETTARRVEWFIDKTVKYKLDGVIGLNLFTLQEALKALGPVEISDYQEQITSENLFERAEYHAEVNFFPEQTQKKEFLAALTEALFAKMQEAEQEDVVRFAQALYTSLEKNHTAIALQNQQTQAVISQLGWDGNIAAPPCPTVAQNQRCTEDYLFVVDANLGVNKANYFIKRNTNVVVTINKDRGITNKLTVAYRNTATSSTWPAGDYKNYQRIYLPADATVTSVKINGQERKQTELTIESLHNKTVVGYLVTVPPDADATAEVTYSLAEHLATTSPAYTFYWQKQPGTEDDPLTISVIYPTTLAPEVISPQATVTPQQILFQLSNTQDRRITIAF